MASCVWGWNLPFYRTPSLPASPPSKAPCLQFQPQRDFAALTIILLVALGGGSSQWDLRSERPEPNFIHFGTLATELLLWPCLSGRNKNTTVTYKGEPRDIVLNTVSRTEKYTYYMRLYMNLQKSNYLKTIYWVKQPRPRMTNVACAHSYMNPHTSLHWCIWLGVPVESRKLERVRWREGRRQI